MTRAAIIAALVLVGCRSGPAPSGPDRPAVDPLSQEIGVGAVEARQPEETPSALPINTPVELANRDAPHPNEWGEPMGGLRASLSADRAAYGPGDDPVLTFSLQSVSEEKLACVLPSSQKGSEFPLLLSFSFRAVGGVRGSTGGQPRHDGPFSMNPGANEYSVIPTGNVFSASFRLSSLTGGGKPTTLVPAVYDATATFFIRASTPKYGPRVEGAMKWAGHHLRTNVARFEVRGEVGKAQPAHADGRGRQR